MKREYYNQHSDVLNENMSMIVYGEGGYPVIAFQAQDAKSNNFEDFGMIDALAPFIDAGRIQVFSVDNLDEQSWSDEGGDKGARAWRQEEYFKFVTDELVPRVHAWNNSDRRPIAVGCSMGATHAAIAALRRPDLFQGCIALSGVYRTSFFFGDWMDENLYNNDIPAFLSNMPADHPYVDLYNQRQLVMCVGQGAWEEGVDDLHFIDDQLNRLGVAHWCDFWGTDVNHDWPWWRKQMPYFMAEVLSDIEPRSRLPSAPPRPRLPHPRQPQPRRLPRPRPLPPRRPPRPRLLLPRPPLPRLRPRPRRPPHLQPRLRQPRRPRPPRPRLTRRQPPPRPLLRPLPPRAPRPPRPLPQRTRLLPRPRLLPPRPRLPRRRPLRRRPRRPPRRQPPPRLLPPRPPRVAPPRRPTQPSSLDS